MKIQYFFYFMIFCLLVGNFISFYNDPDKVSKRTIKQSFKALKGWKKNPDTSSNEEEDEEEEYNEELSSLLEEHCEEIGLNEDKKINIFKKLKL